MKLKELEDILYSQRGYVQFATVYDAEQEADIASGCTIDWAVKTFAEKEVVHIQAAGNQLIITVK